MTRNKWRTVFLVLKLVGVTLFLIGQIWLTVIHERTRKTLEEIDKMNFDTTKTLRKIRTKL